MSMLRVSGEPSGTTSGWQRAVGMGGTLVSTKRGRKWNWAEKAFTPCCWDHTWEGRRKQDFQGAPASDCNEIGESLGSFSEEPWERPTVGGHGHALVWCHAQPRVEPFLERVWSHLKSCDAEVLVLEAVKVPSWQTSRFPHGDMNSRLLWVPQHAAHPHTRSVLHPEDKAIRRALIGAEGLASGQKLIRKSDSEINRPLQSMLLLILSWKPLLIYTDPKSDGNACWQLSMEASVLRPVTFLPTQLTPFMLSYSPFYPILTAQATSFLFVSQTTLRSGSITHTCSGSTSLVKEAWDG